MFIREKKNRSGSVSVVAVSKQSGRYNGVHVAGVSSDPSGIKELRQEGLLWIRQQSGMKDMFLLYENEKFERESATYFFNSIENILLNGTLLILNRVFKLIGFDRIEDTVFRQLAVSRLCQPVSKAGTVEYLKSHFDEDVHLYQLYEYLDKLHDSQKERVEQISVNHTRKLSGGKISLVFYDVTTLYFETDTGDGLRKPGFSKDGKHALPQVVLGLLVSEGGYPLAYAIHEGNKYEGHTMLPVVKDFVKKFDLSLKDFVVVADSGLMNSENIKQLQENGYRYIIGARLRNGREEIKQWILSLEKTDGSFYELGKLPKTRLIVGYSEKRAKKDAFNREKGIRRLEKEYKSGSITADKINKRGYNKFLELSGNVTVNINYEKVKADSRWDGLKGYITNTLLPENKIYEEYSGLWQVERAFRITKGTIGIRPVFHFTAKRIKAHVCICFVAYKVYKELERILKTSNINLGVDKVLSIAKTITTIRLRLKHSNRTVEQTMLITERHKSIAQLFDDNFRLAHQLPEN